MPRNSPELSRELRPQYSLKIFSGQFVFNWFIIQTACFLFVCMLANRLCVLKPGLTDPEKKLIFVHGVFTLAQAFSGGFTHLFLWRLKQDLTLLARYDFYFYISTGVAYLLLGYLLKRWKTFTIFSLSFILFIAGYSLIIAFKEKIIFYLGILALVKGIGNGFYWSAYNLLRLNITRDNKREVFLGSSSSVNSLISLAVPAISGFIISQLSSFGEQVNYTGYYAIFAISILFFLTAVAFSKRLPQVRLRFYEVRDIFKKAFSQKFRLLAVMEILSGFFATSTSLIGLLFSFFILKSEFRLGVFATVFGLTEVVYIYAVGKKIKPLRRIQWALVGTLLSVIGSILFIVFLNFPALVIRQILTIIGGPLAGLSMTAILFSAIDYRSQNKIELEAEYLACLDWFLEIGRLLGIGAFLSFLFLAGAGNFLAVRIWYLFFALSPLVIWLLYRKIYRAQGGLVTPF